MNVKLAHHFLSYNNWCFCAEVLTVFTYDQGAALVIIIIIIIIIII